MCKSTPFYVSLYARSWNQPNNSRIRYYIYLCFIFLINYFYYDNLIPILSTFVLFYYHFGLCSIQIPAHNLKIVLTKNNIKLLITKLY